jgi:hypothetical protein
MRREKVQARDRDGLEKDRLASRVECHRRFPVYDEIVKPSEQSPIRIDDVDRFDRDYTRDQKTAKQRAHDLTMARAASRHSQQEQYSHSIDDQRRRDAAEVSRLMDHMARHDFGAESVLYDPVTNEVPLETTDKGASQRALDAKRNTFREARARRIQRSQNSTPYDPVTGQLRTFW